MTWRFISLEKALGALVVLTLVAVLAERALLKTTLTLDPADFVHDHYSDRQDGGNSESELLDSEALDGRCVLRGEKNYPFCGFEVIFDPDRVEGLDLRNFEHIRLWLDYQGPTPSIRLYLRNHDPAYSKPEVLDSTKYNQIVFSADLARSDQPLDFSMGNFFVANWWFERYGLKPSMAQPQFDNIVILEVQTGSNHQLGEHRFRLEKVELEGQVLATETWYQAIMGTWLVLALGFLGARVVTMKGELRRKNEREQELVEINTLLDSRSRQLEEQAKTDPLTGAFNRTGIQDAVRLGLADWRREGKALSIIMLDLDHFKQLNDSCGHSTGDRILTQLTGLVQQNVRAADTFARWGGEEFLLVCRDTTLNEARGIAEKLCSLIRNHDFGETGGHAVTASFGVAALGRNETLDQLFDRVDRALYVAKERGRDRVLVSDTSTGQ